MASDTAHIDEIRAKLRKLRAECTRSLEGIDIRLKAIEMIDKLLIEERIPFAKALAEGYSQIVVPEDLNEE